jgi:hypothetical protein
MDEPFLEGFWIDADIWNLTLMFLLLVLTLGKNAGNAHTYFPELLLPFLMLTAIPAIEKEIRNPILRMGCLFACLTCLFPLGPGSRLVLINSQEISTIGGRAAILPINLWRTIRISNFMGSRQAHFLQRPKRLCLYNNTSIKPLESPTFWKA